MEALNAPQMLKVALQVRSKHPEASDMLIWAEKNPNGCFWTNRNFHLFNINDHLNWSNLAARYCAYRLSIGFTPHHQTHRKYIEKAHNDSRDRYYYLNNFFLLSV